MANIPERVRQRADDVLRISGLWPLWAPLVSAVTAGVIGIWAYLKGAPAQWLAYVGGFVSGTLFVLLVIAAIFVFRRQKLRAQMAAQVSGPLPKGFVDYQIESFESADRLNTQLARMTAIADSTTKVLARGTIWMARAGRVRKPLTEGRLKRFIGLIVAKGMNRDSERLARVVDAYDATGAKLIESQREFLNHLFPHLNKNVEIAKKLRESLIAFRDSQSRFSDSQRQLVTVLTETKMPTGDIILAARRRAEIVGRSIVVSDQLGAHATQLIASLDAALGI